MTGRVTPESVSQTVKVLLPLPLEGPLDYSVPAGMTLALGQVVRVPVGPRKALGVVWELAESADVPAAQLKPVDAVLALPPLPPGLRRLIDWVAAYTLNPAGRVLRLAMSARQAFAPPPQRTVYRRAGPPPERMTPARRRVLAVTAEAPPMSAAAIAAEAGCSDAVIRGLAEAGTLVAENVAADEPFPRPDASRPGRPLSPDQQAAASALVEKTEAGEFAAILLEGVTGSGKTEVYLEAIAAAIGQDQSGQVLVLVPEIALTGQWLTRFEERFGVPPAEWHSGLGAAERRRVWRGVAGGEVRVVVGARSALFLPFPYLRLVIVDEEHDPSFKQEDGVIYNARDMAVVRAKLEDAPAVLVSATPSLETLVNAREGRYERLHLPNRHGRAEMPDVALIDMRRTPPPRGGWLSPALAEALKANLEQGEQALLFLNRRGYAPLTLCRHCGYRFQCPHCAAWMVDHRLGDRLQCHHCGFALARPESCPECGKADALVACGPGVERLAEEIATLCPAARQVILSSDMVGGPRALGDAINRIAAHEVDVVIGTQIVAKGHHFPMLTMVGVVDADLSLAGGDLRAGERTYQLLSQVAGRAGREDRPGRVYLQTYMPDHPVMAALGRGDAQDFIDREIAQRREYGWPPFTRLAAIIVAGSGRDSVVRTAERLARAAPAGDGITVLGPAPAPLALLRGKHRYRLLLKTAKTIRIQSVLRAWLARVRADKGVAVSVDIDPQSFM